MGMIISKQTQKVNHFKTGYVGNLIKENCTFIDYHFRHVCELCGSFQHGMLQCNVVQTGQDNFHPFQRKFFHHGGSRGGFKK